MTVNETDRTVVTEEREATSPSAVTPDSTDRSAVRTRSQRTTTATPGGSEMARRVIVFVFGLIQVAIGLRFVLLLLAAREANGLVSVVLNVSQVFVAPFEGILRTDALHASGSTFDVTAVVAFVGWTVLEMVILWAVGIFRREPA